jgi:hypothetical protein
MEYKFPRFLAVMMTLLVLIQFYSVIYPILNSFVSVKIFVTGTEEQFIEKKFYTKTLIEGESPFRGSREIGLTIGYSNKSYNEPNSFEYRDFSKALLRNCLITLFPAILFMSLIAIGILQSSGRFRIAFIICTMTLLVCIFSNLLFLPYNSDKFFFPETIKHFNPLIIRSGFDYTSTNLSIFSEFIFLIMLGFLWQQYSNKNTNSVKELTNEI